MAVLEYHWIKCIPLAVLRERSKEKKEEPALFASRFHKLFQNFQKFDFSCFFEKLQNYASEIAKTQKILYRKVESISDITTVNMTAIFLTLPFKKYRSFMIIVTVAMQLYCLYELNINN